MSVGVIKNGEYVKCAPGKSKRINMFSWTKNYSNFAAGTQLTETLTLEPGVYAMQMYCFTDIETSQTYGVIYNYSSVAYGWTQSVAKAPGEWPIKTFIVKQKQAVTLAFRLGNSGDTSNNNNGMTVFIRRIA